ncbi:MAG: ComF family protein [Bacteroidota bacterium]
MPRRNLLISFYDFMMPRLCPACSAKLGPNEECICSCCEASLPQMDSRQIATEYNRRFSQQAVVSGFFSLYIFERNSLVQNLLHSIKYQRRWQNAVYMGSRIAEKLVSLYPDGDFDMVVPVPLHRIKEAERGYNQSLYICRGICKILNKPLEDRVLYRKRFTQTQTHLSVAERERNVKGAFGLKNAARIEDKSIILADDVITTGATVQECAKVLTSAGARSVFVVSVAIA